MGGTPADFEQAEYIRKLWTNQGLDRVTLHPYRVMLSFPDLRLSSKVIFKPPALNSVWILYCELLNNVTDNNFGRERLG